MKSLSAALKVGITAVLIVALGVGAFRFVNKSMHGPAGPVVWALFRDATGLVDKSRVQVAGLIIGEIIDRRLAGNMARVVFKMKPDVEIWSNAVIYKKSSSLLGEYYVEVDPGTPESPDPLTGQMTKNRRLRDNDQLTNVVEAVTTSDILYQVNETLPIVRDILRDVQRLTQGPVQDIARDVQASVVKNSEAVTKLIQHVDLIAQDVRELTGGQGQKDITAAISNVREITEGLRDLVGKGSSEVDSTGAKLRQNLDKVSSAVEALNQSLTNVAAMTGDIRKGKGTVGRLLVDETIGDNVQAITEDARDFVRTLGQLQTVVGLRSEYYIATKNIKNAVEVRLQTRPDKYYQVELIDDPRSTIVRNRQRVTSDDPARAAQTLTDTETESRGFKVSFQFAKKFIFDPKWVALTVRYGIKESTGGLGVDLDLFREHLTVRADLFDFRGNRYPRLRLTGLVQFWHGLSLMGGVDDVMNDLPPGTIGNAGRDFYVGGQLMFNDQDLKALLTIGGSALGGAAR